MGFAADTGILKDPVIVKLPVMSILPLKEEDPVILIPP